MAIIEERTQASEAAAWAHFSTEYERKVFSVTTFAPKRELLLRQMRPGLVLELGCGPLGLLVRDASTRVAGVQLAVKKCVREFGISRARRDTELSGLFAGLIYQEIVRTEVNRRTLRRIPARLQHQQADQRLPLACVQLDNHIAV